MVENVYKNTQMEIWFNMDFNFTWNWRRFDVNVLEKTQYVRKNNLEIRVCLGPKIRS